MDTFNYQNFYNQEYYLNMVPGIPYDREAHGGHWLRFFNTVADRLINYVSPTSVLDVGCAKGFLLEAFYNRGILVHGFDYSEYAISCVREDLKPFAFVASAANSNAFLEKQDSYDLITCIEVVEHMPRDEAWLAIKNMCQSAKSIFFSSTSDDFAEPTHLTVLPRIYWLETFLSFGFVPDYKFDIHDLIPHGILLRKIDDNLTAFKMLIEVNETNLEVIKQQKIDIEKLNSEKVNLENKLQQTQTELERSHSQLQQTQTELERSHSQLQQTQTELERSHSQLHQTQTELERSQSQLQQTQTELERSQSQLQQIQMALTLPQSQLYQMQTELEHWKNLVDWMEGSRFWKLRALCLSLKKKIINFPIIKLDFGSLPVFRKNNYPIFVKRTGKLIKNQIMSFRTQNDFADEILAGVLQSFAESPEYSQWIKDYEAKNDELKEQRINAASFPYQPVLSIILPVYKLPLTVLQETINSVIQQTYSNWELCIAFADIDNYQTIDYLKTLSLQEKRIKLKVMAENKGISGNSNVSLNMASGEFVALLDHDDLLAPFAFYEVISELNKQPDLDFIYSDKDCISANSMVRSRLLLKPEWSPEILYSANYLTHLCIARRTLLEKIGGFRPETDGAQDWDLFLRITENTSRIARINSVLYHWRIIQGSTSLGIDSKPYALEGQLRSIQDHLTRTKLPATVSPHPESGFRLEWQASSAEVSIYIDGDVSWDSLSACIHAVSEFADPKLHKATIVLAEHTYTSKATERENLITAVNLPIDWLPIKEGDSKLATLANTIKQDKTDVVVFVSGLVKKFTEGWIQELSGWVLNHPDIGFVSSLVLTDNNLVVEAGLVVDQYNNGSPLMRGNFLYSWDIFGGALWYRNCSASSPWSIAFSYKNYLEGGGLPSNSPSLSHSMIKLCQAIRVNNKRGLVNPHARAFLQDLPKNDIPEFDDSLGNDPYFHPAFSSVVPLKLRVKNGKKN